MTSPDGRINLRVGDSAVPAFTVPNLGAAEGMRYSTGVDWVVAARYLPGKDFAIAYAQGRFRGMCQERSADNIHEMQLKSANALPPVLAPERQVIARTAQGELVNTTTAGEALFRCVANGQELAAYAWAETTLTASNFSPIRNWAVTGLVSLIAPRAQAPQALQIPDPQRHGHCGQEAPRAQAPQALQMLDHSARSFTLNP